MALSMLAVSPFGRLLSRRVLRSVAAPIIGGVAGAAGGAALTAGGVDLPFIGGGDEVSRRRRRRRALTQGDRDDISFITGMLGAPAGKQFALTLAGRSR